MSETTFHPTYADVVRGLPPSQLREAYKRLSTAKKPLTDEEIVSEHPRVAACLEKISQAYGRKKTRSAVASKARRDATRSAGETIEPLEPAACEIADIAVSLEAATIECTSVEPTPVEPTPVASVEPTPVDYEAPSPPPPSVSKKTTLRREDPVAQHRAPLLVSAKKSTVASNSLVSRR
jgi:hypothetical protein